MAHRQAFPFFLHRQLLSPEQQQEGEEVEEEGGCFLPSQHLVVQLQVRLGVGIPSRQARSLPPSLLPCQPLCLDLHQALRLAFCLALPLLLHLALCLALCPALRSAPRLAP